MRMTQHIINSSASSSIIRDNPAIKVRRTLFLKGTVQAPPSKSYSHRAIIVGSMNGNSIIHNFLDSKDTKRTISSWRELGAKIEERGNKLLIEGFNGHPNFQTKTINVGESGTLLRFILSIASLGKGKIVIDGEGTLRRRTNSTIVKALKELGVSIEATGSDYKVPITINAEGELDGGEITIRGDVSSQVFSSLLIMLPLAKNDSLIKVEDSNKLVSRPYIDITIDMLHKAGIEGIKNNNYESFEVKGGQQFKNFDGFVVPGDYSSAAFLIAAASLIASDVRIEGLKNDAQGDKEIINIINRMGGNIKKRNDFVKIDGPFDLEGIDVDCRDTPDIVPVIAALAVFAKGQTRISKISHLTYKESNRIESIKEELSKLDINVTSTTDEILIKCSEPNIEPNKTVELDSHDDHRIAMCLTIIGLRCGNLKIDNAKCIDKSYPKFIYDMKGLGADIELEQPMEVQENR